MLGSLAKIRTILFEIVGACIGIATLIVAVLTLGRMPKQKQPGLEPPPLVSSNHLPSQHAESQLTQLTQSHVEPVELDAVQTAIEIQYEQPAIRNLDARAVVQLPGTMVVKIEVQRWMSNEVGADIVSTVRCSG
jgi:hypothetical protein